MQKGHHLQFDCLACKNPVHFSIFELEDEPHPLPCTSCKKQYAFDDDQLFRQLKKFEALCRQIVNSQEILGNTSVGIDVGGVQVKIPYKLLLTRFNSSIDLMIEDEPISITFRLEPALDFPEAVK